MEQNEVRAEIYLLLSEIYKQPVESFVREQADMVRFLREGLEFLAYPIPAGLFEEWPELAKDLPTLAAAYHRSFLFPPESRIVPVESVYRPWTRDAGAEIPFGGSEGLLMSDHALHMNALYESFGLAPPPEYKPTPDHLSLELEFAALLLQRNDPERHAVFIREHLDWVDRLAEDALRQDIPAYYLQAVKLTAQFLARELRRQEE